MQLPTSLLVLALSVSIDVQDFQGSPAGGATAGQTLDFPYCAVRLIVPRVNAFHADSA